MRGLLPQPRLASVIAFEIFCDGFGVGILDRRAIGLYHFSDLSLPQRSIRERRVHRNVIEAVTRLTIGLDLVETGCFFQLYRVFVGGCGKPNQCSDDGDQQNSHNLLPYALSVMFCITLLW